MGKLLLVVGLVLVVLGLVVIYAPWMVSWLGKLPGDIHIQNQNSQFFFPVMSMIIVSVVVSLILNVLGRH